MHVIFPAALDNVACEPGTCACRDWLGVAAKRAGKRRRRGGPRLPMPQAEWALVDALLRHTGDDPPATPAALAGAWDGHPVYGWITPDGVEVAFSTLCAEVRARLAATDEPVALATADGGWRRPLQVFRFDGDKPPIRLSPEVELGWSEFAATRDAALDLVADHRHPLLARLAQVVGLLHVVQQDRALPQHLPPLTARTFLAFRGFLEARVAAADAESMARFGAALLPLISAETGLQPADAGRLLDTLNGDWRDQLKRRMVAVESSLWSAIEAWLGVRIFAMPLCRDQSIARATAELIDGFAHGLRFAAALAEIADRPVDPPLVVAALSLGEHHVAHAGAPLPPFTLPEGGRERGPRMADLDMTLASIC